MFALQYHSSFYEVVICGCSIALYAQCDFTFSIWDVTLCYKDVMCGMLHFITGT